MSATPNDSALPPVRLPSGGGNVLILGDSGGQIGTGGGNQFIQVVLPASGPAKGVPPEPAAQHPWRFTLTEIPEGTLRTKVKASLRIEPPAEGGRRIVFAVEVPIPTEAELSELGWYCRPSIRTKTPDPSRANKVEDLMDRCGAAMMAAIIADPQANSLWSQAVDGEVLWELEGSPAFHCVPWEWLLDQARKLHPALRMHLRRRMTKVPVLSARSPESGPLRILWVTARPGGKPARDVVLAPVRQALGGKAEISVVADGSYTAMLKHLREHAKRPCFHLVHLDMHGAVATHAQILLQHALHPGSWQLENRSGGRRDLPSWQGTRSLLFFEENGKTDPVTAQELAAEMILNRMPLVVLNACESALATEDGIGDDGPALTAELVKAGGFSALGSTQALTVEAAVLFFQAFYHSLAVSPDAGRLDEAVREGRLSLNDRATRHGVPLVDWHLPVWYAARDCELPSQP